MIELFPKLCDNSFTEIVKTTISHIKGIEVENVLVVENFAEKKEEKSLLKYLSALNFHDLMVEAEEALKEINSGLLNREQMIKAKSILKEFSNRLKSDTDGFEAPLNLLNESFAKNALRIKNIL